MHGGRVWRFIRFAALSCVAQGHPQEEGRRDPCKTGAEGAGEGFLGKIGRTKAGPAGAAAWHIWSHAHDHVNM
eukprot:119853-Chlamydomonas_euryale.AAC.4